MDPRIRPIEVLVLPASLDGHDGQYRAPPEARTIDADTDRDAIQTYLARIAGGGRSHTHRAYRRELERVLLWATAERAKPLSSLDYADATAFAAFLADPLPRERWCGPRGRERGVPQWRPFEGPLAPGPQRQALGIVATFFDWAVDVGYLRANPFRGLLRRRAARATEAERSTSAALPVAMTAVDVAARVRGRALTPDEWAWLLAGLPMLDQSGRQRRLAVVLALAYSTGLRLTELTRLQRAHMQRVAGSAGAPARWRLAVDGKGSRARIVGLLPDVEALLSAYMVARGLPADLAALPPGTFLIGAVDDLDERLPAALIAHLVGVREAHPAVVAAQRVRAGTVDIEGIPGVAADGSSDGLAAADGIKGAAIYRDLKRYFRMRARALEARDREAAARLHAASTHWLRHTFATHLLAAGIAFKYVQDALGHASGASTGIYLDDDTGARLAAVEAAAVTLPVLPRQ